ncbi:MAG: thioredoxin [Nanoarchaeota archaeon]
MDVDENNFEKEVIGKSKKIPVLVDFWAEWCGPCKMLGPVLEKVADRLTDKFILAKVDVTNNESLAQRYGIRSIPAVKLFKDGKVVAEFIGYMPEDDIKEWLEKNL